MLQILMTVLPRKSDKCMALILIVLISVPVRDSGAQPLLVFTRVASENAIINPAAFVSLHRILHSFSFKKVLGEENEILIYS